MPSTLFAEGGGQVVGSTGPGSLEEQRALQLAFELSMLGLEGPASQNGTGGVNGSSAQSVVNGNGLPGSIGVVVGADNDQMNGSSPSSVFEEARSKKSQNMTECVPVPSSEHVAEIVGRQGNEIRVMKHVDFLEIIMRIR